MTEHPPRHQLEDFLADAARVSRASELRAHLAVCERCSERLRNMEGARAAFAREQSASDFARKVMAARPESRPGCARAGAFARKGMATRRTALRRGYAWATASGALALAAVAMLALPDSSDDAIRYRGTSVSLQAYVQHGTGVHALRDGEALPGGTQLAFAYALSEPQHLLLFGIDDAGTITRYFPDSSIAQPSALPAGAKRQLPVGIELDARRGRERLIALFSTEPLDREAARGALESAWRQVRAHGKDISEPLELALPAKQISLWFDKR